MSAHGPKEAREEGLVGQGLKRKTRSAARLGDLVAAAFDEAARYSADPREVSRLATQAVRYLLRRAGRMPELLPATRA